MKLILVLLLVLSLFAALLPAALAEPVTLEYACMFTEGEPNAQWLKDIIPEFEAQTGIKVDITFVGRDVLTKIKSRVLTNDPPDLVDQDHSELFAAFLSGDETLLTDLDDFLKSENWDKDGTVADQFNMAMLEMYAKDGKVLCFFRNATKFKERYAVLGFNDSANLDDGSMWPVVFALAKLTKADEARIRKLVKRAVR